MYMTTLSLQAIALITIITLLSLFATLGIVLVITMCIDGIGALMNKKKGVKKK